MINLILSGVFGVTLLILLQPFVNLSLLNFLLVLAGPILFLFFNKNATKRAFQLIFNIDLTADQISITNQLTDMSNIARKDGILALEKIRSDDNFMQSMINHCVDGADPEFLESAARNHMETASKSRNGSIDFLHKTIWSVIMWGAAVSLFTLNWSFVAYGIIMFLSGTVLITTLQREIEAKQIQNETIVHGIVGIQKGVNPRMLQESMYMFDEKRVNGTGGEDYDLY